MKFICPRCQTVNERDAKYCKTCGTGFNIQPIRQNSISTPAVIILVIVAMCGFCGIFGVFSGNKTEPVTSTNSVKSTGTASSLVDSFQSSSSTNSERSKKVLSGRLATVISENANLRQGPNNSGEVIQTLSQETKVEILRQKGPWFYVGTGEVNGWLHGNTIRLDENLAEQPTVPTNSYIRQPSVSDVSPSERNKSGASALCRDGTLSYSAHRRGTCSHHGGVAEWY